MTDVAGGNPGRELSGTGMKSLEEQLADAHRMIGILHGALFSLPCCVQDMITDADDLAFYRKYRGYDDEEDADQDDPVCDREGANDATL